ncbi:hypothetical protein LQ953_16110, partial [Sphingomonas sp. IC-56]|uniref:hypothetical protein n=1 Tax=Sphingomonas sp. IC-56 TaxID=2898529 RepID=UPI001E58A6BC
TGSVPSPSKYYFDGNPGETDTKLGRAVSKGLLGVDDNHSACCRVHDRSGQTRSRHPDPALATHLTAATNAVTASIKKPIHNVKQHAATWGRVPLRQQRISDLHHLDVGERVARAAPSVAAKLRLVALLLQRWPSLSWCELAGLIRLFDCGLVEPIGIEPMT